jgi:hypothetical protein
MRVVLIILVGGLAALNAPGQICVPGSGSPDGTAALYYRYIPSTPTYGRYEFFFRDRKSLSALSRQLVPDMRGKVLGANSAADDDFSLGLLFEDIGADTAARRRGEKGDLAFSYFVAWSPDSRWVFIEGGAHKFWHLTIYHSTDGRFGHVELPSGHSCAEYFHAHLPHPRIKRLTVSEKLAPNDYGPAKVCWLRNGVVAIDISYFLQEQDYSQLISDQRSIFYLVDCRAKPKATILGFCR